uniref:Uncharacterized protein n=1 Tax=Rhizophora mucronata TaxID=61149 RepID=A0A2P2PC95_RHIMU
MQNHVFKWTHLKI